MLRDLVVAFFKSRRSMPGDSLSYYTCGSDLLQGGKQGRHKITGICISRRSYLPEKRTNLFNKMW
jgi:hypothetical protein